MGCYYSLSYVIDLKENNKGKWRLRPSNIGYSSCCVNFRRRSYLFGIRKTRHNYSGSEYCHLEYGIIICPYPMESADWRHILDLANSRCVQTLQKTERDTTTSGKMKPCF